MKRVMLALLPSRLHESLVGDLAEELAEDGESGTSVRWLLAVAGIIAYFHVEPYRQPAGRREVLQVLGAGILLILAVHAAAWSAPTPPTGNYDLLSRPLLEFWAAPHLTAALAAGLLVGRMDGPLPADGALHRLHAAFAVGGLLAVVAPTLMAGLLAGSACVGAAMLGAAARTDAARH